MPAAISVTDLEKAFNGSPIYGALSFAAERGKITAIFGPNGSGKSTLLNILAGIVSPDGGTYGIPSLKKFEFSYIFQNYRESLLPWRTNFENVALPLEIQGIPRAEIEVRVTALEKLFGLRFDWNRYPYELSGGQQQILAFMRALITRPTLLFIDEPFSALDYENNLRLREYLQKYCALYAPTVLMVTHNIEEAVHLADRILVLSKKPTAVIATVGNPLPYPRTVEMLKTPEFHAVKDQVLEAFREAAYI